MTTAVTDIPKRLYIPAMGIWKLPFPVTETVNMNRKDQKVSEYRDTGMDISDSTISRITEKILPIVKEWQERPLEEVYAVVFMDVIHYHVRSEGRIVKRAVYIALGIIPV